MLCLFATSFSSLLFIFRVNSIEFDDIGPFVTKSAQRGARQGFCLAKKNPADCQKLYMWMSDGLPESHSGIHRIPLFSHSLHRLWGTSEKGGISTPKSWDPQAGQL